MPCAVCRRSAGPLGWFNPKLKIGQRTLYRACSFTCLDILERKKAVIDITENEVQAMLAAGALGGEYLDSLGKTDLAQLEEHEWMQFVESIITGYVDKLQELEGAA